jgi:hypothetical protein
MPAGAATSLYANAMLTKRHLRSRHVALLLGAVELAACASSPELEQVYCYRTLADVSCYAEPDSGHEAQLVGTYQRDPRSQQQVGGAAGGTQEPKGWFFGLIYASADLAGRVLSPVGTIVGMFR